MFYRIPRIWVAIIHYKKLNVTDHNLSIIILLYFDDCSIIYFELLSSLDRILRALKEQ